jgi:hypothetical protein
MRQVGSRSKGKSRKDPKETISSFRGSSSHAEDSSKMPKIEESDDDGRDADHDSRDDDDPHYQGIASTTNQQTLQNNPHQTEDTVIRMKREPVQVPVDSPMHRERVPFNAEDHQDQPGHAGIREQTAQSGGFPECPGPDDDEATFSLLRMIVLDPESQPPPTIDFDMLVRFLCLVDKYCQYEDDRPMEQASVWASYMQPSEKFDDNAIPWLWVMWKLSMAAPFRKLSSIIQRQTRFSISTWQKGTENTYSITLPQTILGMATNFS